MAMALSVLAQGAGRHSALQRSWSGGPQRLLEAVRGAGLVLGLPVAGRLWVQPHFPWGTEPQVSSSLPTAPVHPCPELPTASRQTQLEGAREPGEGGAHLGVGLALLPLE